MEKFLFSGALNLITLKRCQLTKTVAEKEDLMYNQFDSFSILLYRLWFESCLGLSYVLLFNRLWAGIVFGVDIVPIILLSLFLYNALLSMSCYLHIYSLVWHHAGLSMSCYIYRL